MLEDEVEDEGKDDDDGFASCSIVERQSRGSEPLSSTCAKIAARESRVLIAGELVEASSEAALPTGVLNHVARRSTPMESDKSPFDLEDATGL